MASIKRQLERENPWALSHEKLDPTPDQQAALGNIKEWLESDVRFKSLTGYAGTGKTTLLDFITDLAKEKSLKVAVTATTNKAVKVLKEKVSHGSFGTIHSLLNIKPKKRGTKEIFEPINWDKSDVTEYDLVIIDECSMISSVDRKGAPSLLTIIKDQVTKSLDTRVLFSGDPAQLQPINEEKSKCFDFDPVSLTKVIRHGDTIAQKSKLIRESPQIVPIQELIQEPEISFISYNEAKDLFKGFKENPDRSRLLCWTNASVHRWNRDLRKHDYGVETLAPFVEGDIVMANELCESAYGEDIMLLNGEDIMLLNSEEAEVEYVNPQHDAHVLTVRRADGSTTNVKIVKPSYQGELKKELQSLAAAKSWKEFWKVKKSYHDVRHCYAITTHKSQGSTFRNVVIDVRDINKNRDITNRNQLLYVAMTRASERVYILR